MKPYKKIFRSSEPVNLFGFYKLNVVIQNETEKPNIPFTIFTNNMVPLEERKIWLKKIKKK